MTTHIPQAILTSPDEVAHGVVRNPESRNPEGHLLPDRWDESAIRYYGKLWSKQSQSTVICQVNGKLVATYERGRLIQPPPLW
jgi:predicted carbohydrate-binding protein with CBM5 and CBM33 domain